MKLTTASINHDNSNNMHHENMGVTNKSDVSPNIQRQMKPIYNWAGPTKSVWNQRLYSNTNAKVILVIE